MPLRTVNNYFNQSKSIVSNFPIEKIKEFIRPELTAPRRKTQNELLANLSADLYTELEPFMQKVSFSRGQSVFEVGSEIDYVYFPDNVIVSRLALLEDGSMIEVGMVGPEGMLGVRALMGVGKTECRTLAETDGTAARIDAKTLKQFFNSSSELQNVFLRFYEKFLIQVSQKVACRCRHTILKQLCNWLLQFQERTSICELSLTQETIAHRLGARRSSITVAINELEAKKIICCGRGNIEILDLEALAREACECFSIMQCEQTLDFFVKYAH